ncbi:hypothetical protein MRX96_037644 [Rhipicephalus microplus]
MLQSLHSSQFRGLDKLISIYLYKNNLTELPQGIFTNLTSVKNLDLLLNHLTNITDGDLADLRNMKNIRMVNNRLTSLPANLFKENTKLLNLDLSYNDLNELPLTVFEKQFVLETLIFYRNNFVTLKAGPFDNLISLKVLSFEYNFIESIEQETFQRLQKLEDLKLGRNKLKVLEGNAPFGLNKKLKRVDLSRNNLIQFPDINWDIYLALEKLNLDYNNITYLRVPNLISTSTEVSLRFNEIKAVQVTELEILKKYETKEKTYNTDTASEHYYHLDGNPFECNCQLYDFIKYLSDNNQKDIALFKNSPSYTCKSPKALRGKKSLGC